MSEVRCQGLPPPKARREHPSRLFLLWGGHSWRSWAGSRVPPASASVVSWPSPLESASTVPSACGDTAHGLRAPQCPRSPAGTLFPSKVTSTGTECEGANLYLCGGDTIQPVTDGETPGEQFGDRGQEPGVTRVWLGESVTCLSGDAEDAKRYGAAQL